MAAERCLSVLIVDDDDADTMMIEEALASAAVPPKVSRVADGGQALEYVRGIGGYVSAPRPDLVLLDLNMPRVSGHQVLATMKSDPVLTAIPVIVLTTSNSDQDILSSYRHHANAYVTKPMNADSFESVVQLINCFYSEIAVLPSASS